MIELCGNDKAEFVSPPTRFLAFLEVTPFLDRTTVSTACEFCDFGLLTVFVCGFGAAFRPHPITTALLLVFGPEI